MTVENTTPNRGYQLPDGSNDLADDVLRLIAALSAIDIDVASQITAIAGKADIGHNHVIADITGLASALAAKMDADARGVANGVAALGGDGKVPAAQLPAALFGAMAYQGTWNANTNTPTIPAATSANKGWYYKVATAGSTTIDGENDWKVGDWIVSNGTGWDKIDNTDQVSSVAGLVGVITASALKAAMAIAIADVSGLTAALAGKATSAQGTKADAALPRTGGTMTGALTLAGAPTTALHAASKQYVDDSIPTVFTKKFESAEQAITAGGSVALSHSFGSKPKIVSASLVCKTAENGYAVGDEYIGVLAYTTGSGANHGCVIEADSSQITVQYANGSPVFSALNTSGVYIGLTNANWKLVVRAYA